MDVISKEDVSKLKKALSKVLSSNPEYKSWIYAVEFKKVNSNTKNYIDMFVYLAENTSIDHMTAMEIKRNIIGGDSTINNMIGYCEVLGNLGYIENGHEENWIYIENFVVEEIRNKKIDSIL